MKDQDLDKFLFATSFLELEEEQLQTLIKEFKALDSNIQKAIALYYKVRDLFLYDPYHLDLRFDALRSSTILQKKRAWCVEKSIVLVAGLRALNIPAKLGYGIVINHIGVERLTKILRRKEIVFHGYVEVFLEGKWVKTTPAFDKRICRFAGVKPLAWDGKTDALLQAFSGDNHFMEYVHFYGSFDDVPIQLMNDEMNKYYPHLFEQSYNTRQFSFFHL